MQPGTQDQRGARRGGRPSTLVRSAATIGTCAALTSLSLLGGPQVGATQLTATWSASGAAARPAEGAPTSTLGEPDLVPAGYRLPVADAVLVSWFRAPQQQWSAGHRGVDLAAPAGTAVHSPADGVVSFSSVVVDRSVVVVTHPDGLRSTLEPVVGELAEGTVVAGGQRLGVVQDVAGHCDEACLHWGVRRGESYLDPLSLLGGGGPVVLLPEP